jgi:TonB family protein
MAAVLGLSKSAVNSPPPTTSKLQFVIELEPAYRVFFRNLFDLLLRRNPSVYFSSAPGAFWPDVFVVSRLPWLGFVESTLWHVVLLAALWSLSHVWLMRPQLISRPSFNPSQVLYYAPSEYLPPIDTGSAPPAKPQGGAPEFAKQPIISVPPNPDNRTQTIITPPDLKLPNEVAVPNIVAWNAATPAIPLSATSPSRRPSIPEVLPVAPPPDVEAANSRRLSAPESAVIAPAPDVGEVQGRRTISSPQVAVVAPPPAVEGDLRRIGSINMGQGVVGPAPQLPVPEQRVSPAIAIDVGSGAVVPPPPSLAGAKTSHPARMGGLGVSGQVVPPPPSLQGAGAAAGGGRIIALGIHPSAAVPPPNLAGNRRGKFAATPEGKAGAPGTPEILADARGTNGRTGGSSRGNGGGVGQGSSPASTGIPSGIYVGAGPRDSGASSVAGDPKGTDPATGSSASLVADTRLLRVTVKPHIAAPALQPPNDLERSVFRDRKSYSMILNMPNLNSAGGSWIIRFAEKTQNDPNSDLTAPEATRKVDPGYPAELMRRNVHGTVILYAVIHRDGTVGDVRVLSSVDERLDRFATAALSHWQFRPAMRDGNAVDLEAVVTIPFRPKSNF